MPNHNHANVNPPARTHAEAAALFAVRSRRARSGSGR